MPGDKIQSAFFCSAAGNKMTSAKHIQKWSMLMLQRQHIAPSTGGTEYVLATIYPCDFQFSFP